MTFLSQKSSKTGTLIVQVILFLWILFAILLSGYLVCQERYYPATGWGIISVLFILFFILSFVKPRETETSHMNIIQTTERVLSHGENDDLVLLFSTKDHLKAHEIEQRLDNEGIYCIIFDEHGTMMMSFLPTVEMRVMVLRKDFGRSADIIKDILE